MCLGGTDVTDARARPGGKWASAIVSEPGPDGTIATLRMWSIADGREVELLSDPAPSTGRGLSGGVHVWHPDGESIFVVVRRGGIVRVELVDDAPARVVQLPFDPSRSWSTPAVGGDGRAIAAVADWREVCTWNLDDANDPDAVESVHSGHDFTIDCEWWRDRVIAVAWDRPHMPWTGGGIIGLDQTYPVPAQQPRSLGHSVGWIADPTGFHTTVVLQNGEADIHHDPVDMAGPTWGPGQRSWTFGDGEHELAYTRNVDGFGELWALRNGTKRMVGRGVHGCLSWESGTLVALRTGARTPTQVVAYTITPAGFLNGDFDRTVLFDTGDPRWRSEFDEELVEPAILHTDTGTARIVSRVYDARRSHGGLIVWVHGGPHDQWQVTWRPRFSYWLSRGWTICVPDHRGSSGHGSAFMRAQEGAWGSIDAEDTLAAARDLWTSHGFDPATTVLMGGSAGGLTALNTARLARSEGHTIGGVVVSFPVVDLDAMFDGDDPFESHDMPRLIGPRSDPSVARRSPHLNAAELTGVPILVFHGDRDTSVPLFHSEQLVDAVEAAGGDIELVVMEGEGHGFRDPANIGLEYARTEVFLGAVIDRTG